MSTNRAYNHHSSNGTRAEILEVIREMPDITAAEILGLMPHRSSSSISSMIHSLKREGVIEVSGKKQGNLRRNGVSITVSTYRLSSNPTPNVVKMKNRQPSETALNIRIRELENTVIELRAWKNEAITRYPDLGVDPVVLKARKLVAEEVRAGGDYGLADQIIAGTKDSTLMVRVAIKALEEVA